MKKILILFLLSSMSYAAIAQLNFKDINSLINPLNKGLNISEPQVIGLMDSLESKGEIFMAKDTHIDDLWLYTYTITTLHFENLVDTVRKEKVKVVAELDQDNNVYYTVTIRTRDKTQYDQWISSVAHDGSYIIHRDQQMDFRHRIWKSYLPGAELRTWDFSAFKGFDPRTRKEFGVYQVRYTRYFPYKNLKPSN